MRKSLYKTLPVGVHGAVHPDIAGGGDGEDEEEEDEGESLEVVSRDPLNPEENGA